MLSLYFNPTLFLKSDQLDKFNYLEFLRITHCSVLRETSLFNQDGSTSILAYTRFGITETFIHMCTGEKKEK